MNDQVQYPLRERRKRRTRLALVDAAAELFFAHGYEETTLEEVAERAGVHVQTLYRHFPTKEALALAPDRSTFERFRESVEAPDRSLDTLTFWREWLARHAREADEIHHEKFLKRARTREHVPSLAVANLRLWHEYEDVLTRALARDLGRDPEEDRLPRLIACMLWGGHHFAVRRWAAARGTLDLAAEEVAVIDDVIRLFGDQVQGKDAGPARKRIQTPDTSPAPAARRTPAAERTPAAKRTRAARRTPAGKPASGQTPARRSRAGKASPTAKRKPPAKR